MALHLSMAVWRKDHGRLVSRATTMPTRQYEVDRNDAKLRHDDDVMVSLGAKLCSTAASEAPLCFTLLCIRTGASPGTGKFRVWANRRLTSAIFARRRR